MRRVIVIGCPGSGKTTFAGKLAAACALPLFHLDAIWHKPDRTHITREEFDLRLGELLAKDAFIIDGNYSRTLERRLFACDTVFLFDLPVEECLAGAVARLGKPRQDMPWVDTRLDPALGEEIAKFKGEVLPTILALLERAREGRTVVIFQSREEADSFLLRLGQNGEAR